MTQNKTAALNLVCSREMPQHPNTLRGRTPFVWIASKKTTPISQTQKRTDARKIVCSRKMFESPDAIQTKKISFVWIVRSETDPSFYKPKRERMPGRLVVAGKCFNVATRFRQKQSNSGLRDRPCGGSNCQKNDGAIPTSIRILEF